MALDEILATIRAEADETASAVIASARDQAEKMLDRAAAKADDERRRLAGSLDDRARQERSRIISRAHLETARVRRAAREQIYQATLDAVRQRLGELRGSAQYEEILGSLLDEALAVLPTPGAVRVDPGDADIVRRLLESRGLDLTVELDETPLGGVRVIADGRDVDNTLATRLRRADARLRFVAGELAPALRGGEQ